VVVVIDASVAVAMALAGGALGPLEGHELVAPPLLASEATSTIAEMAYRGEIPPTAAEHAIATLASAGIRYSTPPRHHVRAYEIARGLGWAKTYDAEYVALALAAEAPVVTLDARLRRGAAGTVTVLGPAEL